MNERINQLAEEAGIAIWGDAVYMYHPKDTLDSDTLKKFAELIVRECLDILDDEDDGELAGRSVRIAAIRIKKHFGVEE